MIARELISDAIPSVKSTDPTSRVLGWMYEFKINQLPIVDQGHFKGMITEDEILEGTQMEAIIGEIKHTGWETAYVYEGNHIYDAIDMMATLRIELLPVLDEENRYLGVITLRDLAVQLGKIFAVHEPGGVLVLEIPHHSYVLSEIGRIVESADAKVLSLYLTRGVDALDFLVTLKLNVEDLSRITASFERFEYKVVRTFNRVESKDDFQRNLDALIKYLDM